MLRPSHTAPSRLQALVVCGAHAAVLAVLAAPLAAQEATELPETRLETHSETRLDATQPKTVTVQRSQLLMGTLLTVDVEADSRDHALAASERAFVAVAKAEARLSTWREDSELSRLNAADPGQSVTLSSALATDLGAVSRCVDLTGGGFDPSVGPLAAAVGFTHLDLEADSARRRRPDLHLDAGGFGKGAGLDDALAVLRTGSHVHSARLDFGGQLVLYRRNAGPTSSFDKVHVAHPDDRDRSVAEIRVAGGSVATTGHGQRPGHVLDPRSGRPAPDFGSLTVWTDGALERSATLADCLSTGLYVLGPDAALDFAARHDGVEVLVAERAHQGIQIRASAGLAETLTHSTSTFAAAPHPGAAQSTRDDEPHASTHGSSPH